MTETLDIHTKDITVTYDPETEKMVYEITGDSVEKLNDVQDTINTDSFVDNFNDKVDDNVVVSNVLANEEIKV